VCFWTAGSRFFTSSAAGLAGPMQMIVRLLLRPRRCHSDPGPCLPSMSTSRRAPYRASRPDPFIKTCNYDATGEVLHGFTPVASTQERDAPGILIEFDQTSSANPASHGLANTAGAFGHDGACRPTIVFHAASSNHTYLYFSSVAALAPTCYNASRLFLLISCHPASQPLVKLIQSVTPVRHIKPGIQGRVVACVRHSPAYSRTSSHRKRATRKGQSPTLTAISAFRESLLRSRRLTCAPAPVALQ